MGKWQTMAEFDTFEELVEKCGIFVRLVKQQIVWRALQKKIIEIGNIFRFEVAYISVRGKIKYALFEGGSK